MRPLKVLVYLQTEINQQKVFVLLPTIGHCVKAGSLFIVPELLRGNVV